MSMRIKMKCNGPREIVTESYEKKENRVKSNLSSGVRKETLVENEQRRDES